MVIAAPAFLIGALVIFFVIAGIVYMGLHLIVRLLAGNSRLFREKVLSSKTDEKVGNVSIIVALIITAVVFNQISSKGTVTTGIILLYGLTGLGIIVGLISFISSRSSSKSNLRNKSQAMPFGVRYKPEKPAKEVITQTMNYDGQLVYIVGESTDELSLFQCPTCGQMHAVSKGKENFIFDCCKCNNTIHIIRRHKTPNTLENK